jgi:hypothetical protein
LKYYGYTNNSQPVSKYLVVNFEKCFTFIV